MKKIKKYVVEIGYRRFEFTDLEQAGIFARTAVIASEEDDRATICIYAGEAEEAVEAEDDGMR